MKSKRIITGHAKKMREDRLFKARKTLILQSGLTMAQIAREVNRTQQAVQAIVNRFPEKKSAYIQEYIAYRLNVPYEKLWGDVPQRHSITIPDKKRPVND